MFRISPVPMFIRFALLVGVFCWSISVQGQIIKTSLTSGNWNEIAWNPAGTPAIADDAVVNTSVTIPLGTTAEVNNLHIGSTGKLQVNGNLIVHGDLTMANNSPEFTMGSSAVVVVYGNFEAANKINISVSSYLIIHGDFLKDGSSTQGDLSVEDGNIYIFGTVDEDWKELSSCDEGYEGTTGTTGDSCDYGTEEDYENNQGNFPDEIKELISCFKITKLSDRSGCESEDVTFQIDPIENVNYQWQEKIPGGTWTPVGIDSPSLNLADVGITMTGNQYRVLVTPAAGYQGSCKISYSNSATLTVLPNDLTLGAITGETNVCLPASGELTYSIPPIESEVAYSWILPAGWAFSEGINPDSHSISVQPDYSSGTQVISVSISNACGVQKEAEIRVILALPGEWTGAMDSDWNTASNWGCHIIPDLTMNVLIPSGLTIYPILGSGVNGFAKDITIEAGASLEVDRNWLQIGGTVKSTGVWDAAKGSIAFVGETEQIIPAELFKDGKLHNLLINNPAGVTSEDSLAITNSLKVDIGTFDTGNALTLVSDAIQTALIDGSGNGEILGTVTMQRYLDPAFGYKYFSSPFQNSTVGAFAPFLDLSDPVSGFPHFYRYKEERQDSTGNDATGWESYSTGSFALNPLEGYAVNFGKSTVPRLVQISGTVNNGAFERTLYNNNREYTKGFNLVGNPYPSPIDWDASAGWTKNNIDNAIYFFTASDTDQYTGTYSSYIEGGPSSDGRASAIIPSMQGFFVHVSDSPTGTYPVIAKLGMTNEVRVVNFSQQFLKKPLAEKHPLIRITAGFENEVMHDPAVLYFSPLFSPGFEKERDAHKLMNTDPDVPNIFSITAGNEKLAINALPYPHKGEVRIPLGLETGRDGMMVIRLRDIENFSPGTYVYLLDTEKKIVQDLTHRSEYRFSARKGQHSSRFSLLFSETRITNAGIAFGEPFNVVIGNGDIVVRMNLQDRETGILRVNTISGQTIDLLEVSGKESIEIHKIRASGLYFIIYISGDEKFTRKVLVKK